MDSSFVPLKPILEEWAGLAGESIAQTLGRLCHCGEHGLIYHAFAFKSRTRYQYLGTAALVPIVGALSSDHPTVRADGETALADILVSRDAFQDFCRVTSTRLPDAALGLQRRGDWLAVNHMAPPELSSDQVAEAAELWNRRDNGRRQAKEKSAERNRKGAVLPRIRVAPVRGSRRKVSRLGGSTSQYPAGAGGVEEQDATRQARPEAAVTAAAPKPASKIVSEAELKQWYLRWVQGFPSGEKPPSRERDHEEAGRAFPGRSIPRDWLRKLRRVHAPKHWKESGRRKSGRN